MVAQHDVFLVFFATVLGYVLCSHLKSTCDTNKLAINAHVNQLAVRLSTAALFLVMTIQ